MQARFSLQNLLIGAALSLAAQSAASAQQAPSGEPDLTFSCNVEYFGQMNVAVWSKQNVCLRDAQGRPRNVRCEVSERNVRLVMVSGVEQIDRSTGRFSGSIIVNHRPAPYAGVCKLLKQNPKAN